MSSCDNTVLTGQEGLIQFKPLGTTNCVDDYCPFVGNRIYLPCSADYDIGDCIEIERVKIPSGEGISADGGATVVADGDQYYVIDDGKGAAGDVDNCGNDMEGVPYIVVAASADGTTGIVWDVSKAGDEIESGALIVGQPLSVVPGQAGSGYDGSPGDTSTLAGTLPGVELISRPGVGSGKGGEVTLEIDATGAIVSATISRAGSGYQPGDMLGISLDNDGGSDATLQVPGTSVDAVRGNSSEGSYTLRLCDFQTVCGVRSFSIDLSRDELDVTTLPCSVSEACGKELASFRKTQAGFATATGTLEVYFTCDNESIQNKILQGSLQRTQGGATVRLYVCTKTNAQGEIDVDSSLFIEADIQLLGMSFSVDPDNPTTATINFGVTHVNSAFGLS
nr:hypothetical protein 19 [bacterium]